MPKYMYTLHAFQYVQVKVLPCGTQNWNYAESSEKIFCKLCINGFDYKTSIVNFRINQYIDSDKHERIFH